MSCRTRSTVTAVGGAAEAEADSEAEAAVSSSLLLLLEQIGVIPVRVRERVQERSGVLGKALASRDACSSNRAFRRREFMAVFFLSYECFDNTMYNRFMLALQYDHFFFMSSLTETEEASVSY